MRNDRLIRGGTRRTEERSRSETLHREPSPIRMDEPSFVKSTKRRDDRRSIESCVPGDPEDSRRAIGPGELEESEEHGVMCSVVHACTSNQHLLVCPVSG